MTITSDGKARSRTGDVWAGWQHLCEPVSDLWAVAPDAAITDWHCEEFAEICGYIRERHGKLLRPVIGETPRWSAKDTRALMLVVQSMAPSGRSFIAQRRTAEILEAGNHLGRWDIPLPDIPAPLPPAPRSPFQAHAFDAMVANEALFDGFLASLKYEAPCESEAFWGRILASALLYGGLLLPRWLWSLPASLTTADTHCVWVDLYDDRRDETLASHLRWYPDPVTRHLLVIARHHHAGLEIPVARKSGPNVYRVIRRYFDAVGIASSLPRNWTHLQEVVRTRLSLYLPPYLLAHATGASSATSLPPSVHARLREPPGSIRIDGPQVAAEFHRGPGAHKQQPTEDKTGDSEPQTPELAEQHETWPAQLRELARLIRASDPPDAQAIARWLENERSTEERELPPSVERVAEWVEQGLCAKPRKGRVPRRRTAYERFNAAAGRIVGQLGAVDPAALTNPADLGEIYANALEDTTTAASRKRVARGLQSFHTFLCKHHGMPNEGAQVLQAARHGRTRQIPDANYIDVATFERTMQWIEHNHTPRKSLLLRLLASLGFYAGLRRSEAAGVAVADIEGAPDHEVLIRANTHRMLKSANAARQLPLRVLLPPHVLDQLLEWCEMRRTEVAKEKEEPAQAPLLVMPGQARIRDNDPLLDELTQALAQVTGDGRLRYHHLRHSFASRMLVQFWEAEQPTESAQPPWAPGPVSPESRRMREAMLGTAPVQRRTLRLIARMMGHAGTEITVEHYLHTVDDLLGRALRRITDELTWDEIAAISGRSVVQVRAVAREVPDAGAAATLDRLTDRRIPKAQRLDLTRGAPLAGQTAPKLRVVAPDDPIERWMLLSAALDAVAGGPEEEVTDVEQPWNREQLQDYVDALRKLPSGMRRRPTRKNDDPRLIDVPHTNAEKALARQAYAVLFGHDDAGQGGMSRRERQALLNSVQRGWTAGRLITVRFDRLPDAKRWYRLLERLELANSYVGHHTPSPHSRAGGPQAQREHWMQAGFGVHAADTARFPPRNDAGARGYLTVMPARAQDASIPMKVFGLVWVLAVALATAKG